MSVLHTEEIGVLPIASKKGNKMDSHDVEHYKEIIDRTVEDMKLINDPNDHRNFKHIPVNYKLIDDFLWHKYAEIKNIDLDKKTETQKDFVQEFRAWDKGDCSQVGMLIVFENYLKNFK